MFNLFKSKLKNFLFQIRNLFWCVRPIKYAGLATAYDRKAADLIFDKLFPVFRDLPNYESGIILGQRHYLQDGDSLVIIGGGHGITAVNALNTVNLRSIRIYEGSSNSIENMSKTFLRNNKFLSEKIQIEFAIVGEDVGVYDGKKAPNVIEPGEIPPCDVLQLDCEGAEIKILDNMQIRPRCIIVESHGFLGASTDSVASLLEKLGYLVVDNALAEQSKWCIDNDIRVLVGLHKSKVQEIL